MANVVVLGAGLSGTIMAYELVPQLRKGDRLSLIGQGPRYHFVPSNPWVAVGWREAKDISIDLPDVMARKHINYFRRAPSACTRPTTGSSWRTAAPSPTTTW